jgi:hypothetical protein
LQQLTTNFLFMAKITAFEPSSNNEHSHIDGMYKNWFLEYASYVILERAVPHLDDGLKPVQRRILHALKEMDDGRFNKVANVIGQTMQYHPYEYWRCHDYYWTKRFVVGLPR